MNNRVFLFLKILFKSRMPARLFLCAVLLAQPLIVFAFETDQYNLPPQPLADIGDEVSEYTEQNVRKAADKINAEISVRLACLENNAAKSKKVKCGSPEKEQARLDYLRSEAAVMREVYNLLGAGIIPFTKSGSWMESHEFKAQPARYKTGYRKSIFYIVPTNYLTISKTVNLYGAQFGTDKIAHFFQQGYDYYKIYDRPLKNGSTINEAERKAVRWGQKTERTYYGTLVSGIYSNADLYANYAGMKFYQGLTKAIKIGDSTRPTILLLQDGVWTFNEKADLREILIKPFLTDHLNESLVPSKFLPGLRSFVRRTVRKQSCRQWLNLYPNLSQAALNETMRKLQRWHGEDYGFTGSEKFVTIANTCFGDKNKFGD